MQQEPRTRKPQVRWTAALKKRLADLYSTHTATECSAILLKESDGKIDVSPGAISFQAYVYKLKKAPREKVPAPSQIAP